MARPTEEGELFPKTPPHEATEVIDDRCLPSAAGIGVSYGELRVTLAQLRSADRNRAVAASGPPLWVIAATSCPSVRSAS